MSEREPEPAAAAAPELGAPPARTARLRARFAALLPWASLAAGIGGAIFMDRGPKRGALLAGAAVLMWLTLLALRVIADRARVSAAPAGGRRRYALRAIELSSLLATQSLVHLGLFFALPFYVQAASLDIGHGLFLGGLSLLALASLWDPLSEWLLRHPLLAPLLPASASFAALLAVLPGLGLSTQQSLWAGSGIAAAGVLATALAGAAPGQRAKTLALTSLALLLLPLSLWLGAARIVPAVPLRLVQIEIGTRREGRWVADPAERFRGAPERLVCATAIFSPVGVRDRLFHVWTRDGKPRARVELDIRGGRSAGFRTFSRIGPLGAHAEGEYRCRVETQAGQVLGARSVRVGR
jgi:multidrug transporter EmrE-like cation transporter